MKDAQFAKLVAHACSLVPLAMMMLDVQTGRASPDVRAYAIHNTGITAMVFLLLSLSVTPLRKITGKNYWSLFRRLLGLYAFLYAAIHLLCYLHYDRQWDILSVLGDVYMHNFILFGMGAFLLMVPLALTSTVGSIKRLGAKRWKRLHQLVYISASAAAIHFCLYPKVLEWTSLSSRLSAVLVFLLAFRVIVAAKAWLAARAQVESA